MARGLTPGQLKFFQPGALLHSLLERVKLDPDLDLFIRKQYINIYFKGVSLLNLNMKDLGVRVALGYQKGATLPAKLDQPSKVINFLEAIPRLKDNITLHEKGKLEAEFEQLFIRCNNWHGNGKATVHSEYFIIDRQYCRSEKDLGCKGPSGDDRLQGANGATRNDIVSICWPHPRRKLRHPGDTVVPVIIECKYGLNNDIQNAASQLGNYLDDLRNRQWHGFHAEMQTLLEQRAELGLFGGESKNVGTLQIDPDPKKLRGILFFIDCNPFSDLNQRVTQAVMNFRTHPDIKIVYRGLALWDDPGD